MGQTKSYPVTCNLEPTIGMALMNYTNKTGSTISKYLRSLVIKDLKERGILTDTSLSEILV